MEHSVEYKNPVAEHDGPVQLSMDYVLRRIDQVISDTRYIHEALDTVAHMEVFPPSAGAIVDTSRGEAVSAIVQSREATNQQLLKLLERMYDDLKPHREENGVAQLQHLMEGMKSFTDEDMIADVLKKAVDRLL